MRAITCESFGEPDVMKVGEVEIPELSGSNQVLVKVEATAVNRADTL